jgi:outer membrane protein assembly factor BamB
LAVGDAPIFCANGRVDALDPASGHSLWANPYPDDDFTRVAVTPGRVYVSHSVGSRGFLEALDAGTGVRLWQKRSKGGDVFAAPGGRVVIVRDGSGNPSPRLRAFDPRDGQILWTHTVDFPANVAVAGDTVYVTAGAAGD